MKQVHEPAQESLNIGNALMCSTYSDDVQNLSESEKACFATGEKVICRNLDDATWLPGVVMSVCPLLIQVEGTNSVSEFHFVCPALASEAQEVKEEHVQCSICFEDIDTGGTIATLQQIRSVPDNSAVRLPCPGGHLYHKTCILKWLRNHHSCPLCRAHVSARGVRFRDYNPRFFNESGQFRITAQNLRLLDCCDGYCVVFCLEGLAPYYDVLYNAIGQACTSCCSNCVSDINGIVLSIFSGWTACMQGVKKTFGPHRAHNQHTTHASSPACHTAGLGQHSVSNNHSAGQALLHHTAGAGLLHRTFGIHTAPHHVAMLGHGLHMCVLPCAVTCHVIAIPVYLCCASVAICSAYCAAHAHRGPD